MSDVIQDAIGVALWWQTNKGNSASVAGTKLLSEAVLLLHKQSQALQAKIDSLMLEYCPEEMSQEQRDE